MVNSLPISRRRRPLLVLALALLLSAVAVPTAGAQDSDANDNQRNPELFLSLEQAELCEISVIVRHVPVDTATLTFAETAEGPSGARTVLEREVTGVPEEDGNGFRFDEGPFTFPDDEPELVGFDFFVDGDERQRGEFFHFDECRPSTDLTVHQTEESGPVVDAVEGCSFFLEGRNLPVENGTLKVEPLVPFDAEPVLTAPFDAEAQEDGFGFTFFDGPFEVEQSGRYFAALDTPEGESITLTFFDVENCTPAGVAPDCPENVVAEPQELFVLVNFDAVLGAEHYRVYRATAGGEFELVGEPNITLFFDRTAEPGVTYQYRVTAVGEQGESSGCPTVEATAIPFFGGAPLLGALALAGGMGAFVAMRRRG